MTDTLRDIKPETLGWADQTSVKIFESVIGDGFVQKKSPRILDTYPPQDLPGFFNLVNEALTDYQDRKGIVGADRVGFTEEGPPGDLTTEVITYKVVNRRPGAQTGSIREILSDMGVKREYRPRLRYYYDDPNRPLKRIGVMGQFFDNVIELTCWAATNKAVNARALWFEQFMDTYHWYFKYVGGFREIVFVQRLEDKYWEDIKTQGNLLKSRSMQYYVRTDRTYEISESVLRDVLINIAAGTD